MEDFTEYDTGPFESFPLGDHTMLIDWLIHSDLPELKLEHHPIETYVEIMNRKNKLVYRSDYIAFTLCSELYLCIDCHELYGKVTILPVFNNMELKGTRIQRCSCGKPHDVQDRDSWRGFEFPVAADLCSCCGRELVFSGSWSSGFFCRECQALIDDYNRSPRGMPIPCHRRGMVEKISPTGAAEAEGSKQYLTKLKKDHRYVLGILDIWKEDVLDFNLLSCGFRLKKDVALKAYDQRLEMIPISKEVSFTKMLGRF